MSLTTKTKPLASDSARCTLSPELGLAGCTIDSLCPALLGLDYNVTVRARAETKLWVAPNVVRKGILLILLSQSGPLQQGQHKVLRGKDLAVVAHALYPCNKKIPVYSS